MDAAWVLLLVLFHLVDYLGNSHIMAICRVDAINGSPVRVPFPDQPLNTLPHMLPPTELVFDSSTLTRRELASWLVPF